MLYAVLGARARQGPDPRIEVEFLPRHGRNFIATLAGQDQQMHEPGIGPLQAARGSPAGGKLNIAQNPIPRHFDRRRLYSGDWRDVHNPALNREIGHALQ